MTNNNEQPKHFINESLKESINDYINQWQTAFSLDSANSIIAMYHKEAVLLGTFSDRVRGSHSAIADYFNQFFSYQKREVHFLTINYQEIENMVICSGNYTFNWQDNTVRKTAEARYTMVFQQVNRGFKIIHHHSSLLPKPKVTLD